MITIAKSNKKYENVHKRDDIPEIVIPLIINLRLGVYPFYRDNKMRWDWHNATREAMEQAGMPTGEYEDPVIAPDHQTRSVYIIWLNKDEHGSDWTPEKASGMCRRLFHEASSVEIFCAAPSYFSLIVTYKEKYRS